MREKARRSENANAVVVSQFETTSAIRCSGSGTDRPAENRVRTPAFPRSRAYTTELLRGDFFETESA